MGEANLPIVTWETVNDIGILSIGNGSQNKIPQADFLNLTDFQAWMAGDHLNGLIITGTGRHFSAGADTDQLKILKNDPDSILESLKKGREILNYIRSLPIVTVAAINGICFGAGLEIALSCQFRICAENTVLAFPEASLGIMPGFTGTVRLPKLIGYSRALEIILSGRSVIAEEAHAIGLVDRVVSKKELLASAQQFILDLVAGKPRRQLTSIITALNNSLALDEESAKEKEAAMFVELVNRLS